MKYENITKGIFLERPNRFIAKVEILDAAGEDAADGGAAPSKHIETVHVKNTGRCRELLVPGCEVWLTAPGTPGRKTKYDLVAVRKDTGVLFNIDSQAPNKVVREWLESFSGSNGSSDSCFDGGFDIIIPEYTYGDSRIDFYMEKPRSKDNDHPMEKILMEVKGCTLEVDGVGYFPDAPTQRGTKHIRELIKASDGGYRAVLAFVIQMDGVSEVRPSEATDPDFTLAIKDAREAGVEILFLQCHVEPDSLEIVSYHYL